MYMTLRRNILRKTYLLNKGMSTDILGVGIVSRFFCNYSFTRATSLVGNYPLSHIRSYSSTFDPLANKAETESISKEKDEDDVLALKIEREFYLSHLKSFLERVEGEIDSLRLLQDLPDISSRIAFYDYFRMKLIALENIEIINKSEKRLIDFDYKVETSFDYTIGTSFDDIENKLETLPEEEKLTFFRDLLISDFLKIKEKFQKVYDLEITSEHINLSQEELNYEISN